MLFNQTGALATALLLAINFGPVQGVFCTFYSDAECKTQVGSVSYEVGNNNCFANSGSYIQCDEPGYQIRLDQFPQGQCGDTPRARFGFPGGRCTNIAALAKQNVPYKLGTSGSPSRRQAPDDAVTNVDPAGPHAQVGKKVDLTGHSLSAVSATHDVDSTIEKRGDTCSVQVDFYYGGDCIGPTSSYEDTVTEPNAKELEANPWLSDCRNDGLFGNYAMSGARCDMRVYEGENCSGVEHTVYTLPLSCETLNNGGKFTMRSWRWACDYTTCTW